MGVFLSKVVEDPEFVYGETNALVAAGETFEKSGRQKHSLEVIKSYLDRGLDVNVQASDDDGCQFTCLLRACRCDSDGGYAIVECLLEHGADPNMTLSRVAGGYTAAHLAVMNNSKKVLRLLLNNGYDPTMRDSLRHETALELAIRKGKTPNYNPIINDFQGITNEMVDMLAAHGDEIVIVKKQVEDEW